MLPTLVNFVYNWAIFHGSKWTNNENYKSTLVTLILSRTRHHILVSFFQSDVCVYHLQPPRYARSENWAKLPSKWAPLRPANYDNLYYQPTYAGENPIIDKTCNFHLTLKLLHRDLLFLLSLKTMKTYIGTFYSKSYSKLTPCRYRHVSHLCAHEEG